MNRRELLKFSASVLVSGPIFGEVAFPVSVALEPASLIASPIASGGFLVPPEFMPELVASFDRATMRLLEGAVQSDE